MSDVGNIQSADWSMMLDTPGNSGSGLGQVVQGVDDVNQCIAIILVTPKGADPLRPTFGADLWRFIDYPITRAIPALVREITEAITLWEPRVTVISVTVVPVLDAADPQAAAHLNISITWQLKLGVPASPAALQAQTLTLTIPASLS